MKKAIVGKKIGMTQVFTDDGRLVPVTVVEAGPCKGPAPDSSHMLRTRASA